MSFSDPKRPSFVHWLRANGQISDDEMNSLIGQWNLIRLGMRDHKVFTTGPITWDQFVASKYPRKALAYQAYLRVIGAAPTLKKD